MSISVNYPTPVEVNGFSCKNCTDVDYAKKHIDPAHPKDGPFGINAQEPARGNPPAFRLDGIFSGQAVTPAAQPVPAVGTRLNISA